MECEKKCKLCDKKFITNHKNTKYCSDKCRKDNFYNSKIKYFDKKYENGIENVDYVVCQLCGLKMKRIYCKHLQETHHLNSKEYKKMFPGCLIQTPNDAYNVTKNSGKHMKEEKWRKWAADKIKGENNPNHKSKTTEQHRKEISPFSKEFYKKRGLTEKNRQDFIKEALKDNNYNTRIDYWLKQGYSEEEAKDCLKKR